MIKADLVESMREYEGGKLQPQKSDTLLATDCLSAQQKGETWHCGLALLGLFWDTEYGQNILRVWFMFEQDGTGAVRQVIKQEAGKTRGHDQGPYARNPSGPLERANVMHPSIQGFPAAPNEFLARQPPAQRAQHVQPPGEYVQHAQRAQPGGYVGPAQHAQHDGGRRFAAAAADPGGYVQLGQHAQRGQHGQHEAAVMLQHAERLQHLAALVGYPVQPPHGAQPPRGAAPPQPAQRGGGGPGGREQPAEAFGGSGDLKLDGRRHSGSERGSQWGSAVVRLAF